MLNVGTMKVRVMTIGVFLAGMGACLLVVGASRYWARQKGTDRETERTEAIGGATSPDPSVEVAALRQRLARIEQSERLRGQAVGKSLIADAADAERVTRQKQLQEKVNKYYTPEFEAKMFASYFNTLDEARRAEGTDLPWGHEMQAFVQKSLHAGGRALSSLSAQSVECGRTLCRMELKTADPLVKSGALAEFLQKMGPQLPQVSVFVPQDSNKMTAYFARTGVDLPPMESPERLVADLP